LSLPTTCFKAYDLRGRVPDQLNAEIAYAIGLAYAEWLKPGKVVVGHDIRLSSPEICSALTDGLMAAGVDVVHIGICGTEEIYFATDHFGFDGGIVVTASHNPEDYNGMKLVREGARPISGDTGLFDIQALVARNEIEPGSHKGTLTELDHRSAYIAKLLEFVDIASLKPLKIVVNPGNGGAGAIIERLKPFLPFDFVPVHFDPDGHFPNGVPNPLLPENRQPTVDAISHAGADLGIAWDGDFDRCFFFDENGRFIEGYYIVGLLAEAFLEKSPGSAIVHDPRLTWNTIDVATTNHGRPVLSKTGHAFIKERMRSEDAIYGGEMSAHHYFRDFSYCDTGMVPWLLVVGLMAARGKTLAELVDARMTKFPVSGEINRKLEDPAATITAIENDYRAKALIIDRTDGLSMEFDDWRFNVRSSNTEPVVRLNVESRGLADLMIEKTNELIDKLGGEAI
jgi:phosphomannomutase